MMVTSIPMDNKAPLCACHLHWLRIKNPAALAIKRETEEKWQ
jgi:hypothetical protein